MLHISRCCLSCLLSRVLTPLFLVASLFVCSSLAVCIAGPVMTLSFYPIPSTDSSNGGSAPSARCFHYTAQSDLSASFYVAAGHPAEPNASYLSALNDVWSFTASTTAPAFLPQGSWQQQTANSPFPARQGLAGSSTTQFVTSVNENGISKNMPKSVIYLYGGVGTSGLYLDDIWQYDTMPATNSPTWTQVRQLSSARSGQSTAVSPHVVQPTARAFMSWQSMSLPYTLLVTISKTALSTQNLMDFLTATAGNTASTTVFTAFGGRSDPSNNYSTTWSALPQTATTIGNTSMLNADYADLWWYVASADTWIRIGNLTCLNNTFTCTDYKYMNDVVQTATGTSLNDQVTDIQGNFTVPLRPESLSGEVLALYTLVSSLNDTLYDTLSFLMSVDPSYETDTPNACAQSCSSLIEVPNPPMPSSAATCALGVVAASSNCGIYYATRTSTFITITQQRPNATEGYSSAVYNGLTRSNTGYSIYYQFGGFSCAGQYPGTNIFTRTDYASSCFSNTLFALDTSTNNLVWWALTPPGPSSSSNQLLLWPSARVYCSMAIDSTFGQLWLYGGAALLGGRWQYYSDLHVFDVVKVLWLPVTVVGSTPSGTYGPSLFTSTLYTTNERLMLFGGCGGDNPTSSNQLYAIQTNWQLQAGNWLFHGNTTLTITAGQTATIYATAVVSQTQPTPLLFAQGLSSQWATRWLTLDNSGNVVSIQPTAPDVWDLGNGQYAFNFTILSGRTSTMSIVYYEAAPAVYVSVSPAAFFITIQPAPFNARTTTLLYNNYTVVAKLLPTSFTIQLHDTWNNPCLSSQGPIQVSLAYISAADSSDIDVNKSRTTLESAVADNRDGTYIITYLAPDLDTYYLYVSLATALGDVTVPGSPFVVTALDPLSVPSSIQTALLVVSVVVSAVVFAMLLALIYYRNNRVVRAGSPLFLVLICIGVIISLVSVPVYAYPSNVSCRLFPFLLTTGYILALSALFTKSYRVLLIFVRHQLHSMALTDSAMIGLVFVLVSCETILNLVWLISDPLTLTTFPDSTVLTYRACGGPHAVAFVSASVAFNGLIALWGVWLALQIRHVPEAFSESKLMGAALYNLALVMAITIPLTWTASNTQSSHEDLIIPAAAILWCSSVTVLLVIAPKLYYVLKPPPQHFFDGYPTSGVMVKGVKGRGNGHGPNGKPHHRSWSDEGHEAAELAGFDVRRGGAPAPKKWRKHNQGEPVAARRPGDEEEHEKRDVEDGRDGGEVEMRSLKGSSHEQQPALAAVSASAAAPAAMQPLMVEGAPAGFQSDNRRNSLSDRRRPAPIRTTVPTPPAPPLHHQSARSRSRPRHGTTLTTPRIEGTAGKPHTASTGSADSGGAMRLHSPAAVKTNQSASSSPPSSHSQRGLRYSPQLPTPPSQQQPSPPSRPSQFRHSTSVNERSGGAVVA